jgi:hypothetical protein
MAAAGGRTEFSLGTMFLEQLFSEDNKNSLKAAISTKDLENIEPAVGSLQ